MELWWSKFIYTHALGQVDEFSTLLQFKESFVISKSVSADHLAYPKVSFWTREGDGNRSNRCSWDGVECDEDFGHVVGLDLRSSCLYGSINSTLSSALFTCRGLTSQTITSLSKLSTLDMSFNDQKANDSTPLKLTKGNLRSVVQYLTNIKKLHLSGVHIYSTVPDILVDASSLTSLQLDNCDFPGAYRFVKHFALLRAKEKLQRQNPLGLATAVLKAEAECRSDHRPPDHGIKCVPTAKGAEPTIRVVAGICRDLWGSHHHASQPQTTMLHDSKCRFDYPLAPVRLHHAGLVSIECPSRTPINTKLMTTFKGFKHQNQKPPTEQIIFSYLGYNHLQGPIPRSLFQLKNLEYLFLSDNNLSGLVEFDQFSKLKKLKGLDLSNNMLSMEIRNDLSATLPKLQTLALGSCNLTEFPNFLKNQSELTRLDLSGNYIQGPIPKWVWNATTETLLELHLSFNFLTRFDQYPGILPNLIFLKLGFNMLQGPLPIPPQSIRIYGVKNKKYTGEISPLFCNFNNLQLLELSNNNLSGMLPQCLGNSSVLEILALHNNFFSGYIPPICPRKTSMIIVDFSYNQLQGKLPRRVMNCTQLKVLNFANNPMSDIFPSWLRALPELRILILRSNGFHGVIGKPATKHEFPNLRIIDLSSNGFSSMLPSNYLEIWNSMKYVDENQRTYFEVFTDVVGGEYFYFHYAMKISGKGVELKYDKTPYLLTLIDLSSNRFEGEIPEGPVGNLRAFPPISPLPWQGEP
ncbi:unnamed protein product [Prunus armeniaca]